MKKKKEKPKSYSQQLAEKAREMQKKKQEAAEKRQAEAQQQEYRQKVTGAKKDGQLRTSLAKIAGIKSSFCLDEDTLLVTSFGRGNEAVLEHRIEGDNIRKLRPEPALQIDPAERKQFPVSGRTVNGTYPVGYIQDTRTHGENHSQTYAVKQKNIKWEWVEKHFFGSTFSDNIHVQMGYCILDIKKSLAFHVNHIVHALNNLGGMEENKDLIGMLPTTREYRKFSTPQKKDHKENYYNFQRFASSPRLGYFGHIFTPPRGVEQEYNTYQVLTTVGLVRQFCAHHQSYGYDNLYNLSHQENGEARKELLDRIYRDKIVSLNKGFAERAYVNLAILKELPMFRVLSWEQLAGAYYRYVVEKEYKNLGFSIKKLRERLVVLNPQWKEKEFDSVRSKFYQLMDFVLVQHYTAEENGKLCGDMVDSLRRCLTEQEKEALYENAARQLWAQEAVQRSLRGLVEQMDGKHIQNLAQKYTKTEDDSLVPERKRIRDEISRVQMDSAVCVAGSEDADQFCKVIYLLIHFLDGKEINDLLTTLIHQFENIDGFLQVLEDSGLIDGREKVFAENYQIFLHSKAVSNALRRINSFARMSRETDAAKMYMYADASRVLGAAGTDEELVQEWKLLFEKAKEEKARTRNRHPNAFRNFIANNVVDSARFRYLVRYTDLNNVCRLAKNTQVLRFVLGRIPAEQIDRYYRACRANEGLRNDHSDLETKREYILKRIMGFSRDELQVLVNELDMRAGANTEDGRKKQELVTLTSLYLTVLYLVSKNLVLVNARYFMAFYLLELDQVIYSEWMADKLERSWDALNLSYPTKNKYGPDKRGLAAVWVAEGIEHEEHWYEASLKRPSEAHKHGRRMRPLNYLRKNLQSTDVTNETIGRFRNQVEHLNFVRSGCEQLEKRGDHPVTSYFQLYHYVVQKELGLNSSYTDRGTYSKDKLKILCIPFGYSLPRYKNLTIEDLFDKDQLPVEAEQERRRAEIQNWTTAESEV